MHVVALGHDKKIFDQESRTFARQLTYAKHLSSLHVFIPVKVETASLVKGPLLVHPIVFNNPFVLAWRMFTMMYHQLKICQETGPTILVVQSPFEFGVIGLILAKIARVPIQVQVHGDFYSQPYWLAESWGNRIRARVGLFVLRRASGIRVVSKRIANSLVKLGVKDERITILPIEADLNTFFTATPNPIWSPEPDAVYIMSVGRFAREKNLPLLIRAFHEVHRIHQYARLILIGEGPEEPALRALAASLWPSEAPVAFYPWQNKIADIMKAADIYALTSDYEGYAMVLGEAMACGIPVVTTDIGCVGELCLPDIHALVVPPRDEAALVASLTKLVDDLDLRARMAEAGRATIKALEINDNAYMNKIVAGWQRLL